MKWPRREVRSRLDRIIFETSHMPFGLAAYNPNEKVSDFVGRRQELLTLKEQIQLVWNHKISRAVCLEGPAGVGKSSLFNFLKESIEAERIDSKASVTYLSKNTDIFSTYLEAPDKIVDFSDIWKPMLAGLYPGFEEETQCDIGLPEYVALHLIFKMFQNDPDGLSEIIWPEKRPQTPMKYIEFVDIIDPILDGGRETVEKLQAYFRKNSRIIRKIFEVYIDGVHYKIFRTDNSTITELLRVLDENDPENFLEQINNAERRLFANNDELVSYFNDLIRFYATATGKRPLLLIGIDEVAKTESDVGDQYYRNLGNLFVRLRNTLNSILFVFISTTEDWAKYDRVINKMTDLRNQISVFMHRMPLRQLNVDEMTEVFKKRMRRFWEKNPSEKSLGLPYYPFTEDLFQVVFRYNMRDLRNSIRFLHKFWSGFRTTSLIPKFETMFDCLREVRSFANDPLGPDTIKKFELEIVMKSFNEHPRLKSNAARSSAIEKGLEMAWQCLQQESASKITNVQNNPQIRASAGTRKPDIYVEIHGNLGAEFRRTIEFQVKAYRKDSTVKFKQIKSSLELFNEQFTDFLYFILTGKGLDTKAEFEIKKLESRYPTRIRRPPLTHSQEQYLYFLAMYEEITGKPLGWKNSEDVDVAKGFLSRILGQQVEKFLMEIENLAFRKPIIAIEEPSEIIVEPVQEVFRPIPEVCTPEITSKAPVVPSKRPVIGSLSNFSKPVSTESFPIPQQDRRDEVAWLAKHPEITTYRYEASALCSYLQTRENNKRYKNKFTVLTVSKNVIRSDANLSLDKFKTLVKVLQNSGFIEKEKSSFKLTAKGMRFYQSVKAEAFKC
ncbi:MAG: winged helix-turn-helix domain-containing protein [Candidatus Heimdallarchaeota archaeon]